MDTSTFGEVQTVGDCAHTRCVCVLALASGLDSPWRVGFRAVCGLSVVLGATGCGSRTGLNEPGDSVFATRDQTPNAEASFVPAASPSPGTSLPSSVPLPSPGEDPSLFAPNEPIGIEDLVEPMPPDVAFADPPDQVVQPPPAETDSPVPAECRLAPVDPELPDEEFQVLGDLMDDDFVPLEAERWEWEGRALEDTDWPYPTRSVWPVSVELPLTEQDDFELVAMAGASENDFYVVGRRGERALVLHRREQAWFDESAALLSVLPDADIANSVSVPAANQIWVSTPQGLLRSNGDSEWRLVDVPRAVFPLGAVAMDARGFGAVAGGSVATTSDAGQRWTLEARDLGFVAPGLAYSRSFVRMATHAGRIAVVGAYGHLLTRGAQGWVASTVLTSDVAFTDAGQFVTTRRSSDGLFFRDDAQDWQIYPLTTNGGLNRVWASPEGEVFAGGELFGVLHRFLDGTVELLPSLVSGIRDFHGARQRLYALANTSLWSYELGTVTSSGVGRAALVEAELLNLAPVANTNWGQSAASNFEALDCVDATLKATGESVWQGVLAANPPTPRYGSCAGDTERPFSETAFGFTAPVTGSFRIVLSELEGATGDQLRLALRNGCEGWLVWGGGFGGSANAVDIGLEAGQVILIEVYANTALEAPVPFSLSIY